MMMKSGRMPLVVAHRGNSCASPENTMAAVRSALALDPVPDYIEIDLHCSIDKMLMVSHDYDLLRATGFPGLIREMTYQELRNLKVSLSKKFDESYPDEVIPTLDNVLDAVKDTRTNVMIECKQLLMEDAILELLQQRNELERHIIASFDSLTVYRARQIHPAVKTLLLSIDLNPETLWRAKDIRVNIIGVSATADTAQVRNAHQHGLQVWVWTVDDPEEMTLWAESGADAIISNNPGLVFRTFTQS